MVTKPRCSLSPSQIFLPCGEAKSLLPMSPLGFSQSADRDVSRKAWGAGSRILARRGGGHGLDQDEQANEDDPLLTWGAEA